MQVWGNRGGSRPRHTCAASALAATLGPGMPDPDRSCGQLGQTPLATATLGFSQVLLDALSDDGTDWNLRRGRIELLIRSSDIKGPLIDSVSLLVSQPLEHRCQVPD